MVKIGTNVINKGSEKMIKTIAMDIDGTILNKKGKIDENVMDYFKDDRVKNSNLLFMTGNSYKIASALIQEIEKNYPKYKGKKYYVATNNGATIFDLDGNLIYSSPMDKKKIIKIAKKLQKKYKPCDVALSTIDNNYIANPKDEARAKELEKAKKYEDSKGAMGWNITILPKKTSSWINKIGEVYALNFITDEPDAVMSDLEQLYDEKHLIYFDPVANIIQITLSNKWDGLKMILEHEHKINENSNFEKEACDVIFIGDGMNDVICMENCKKSYARGENLKEDVIKSAKKSVVKLEEILDEIF